MEDVAADPAQTDEAVDKIETDADGGELFGIHVVSFFLTLITLGIYRFWWKTRVRRYLLSHVRYKSDAFEYTGTGLELFIGFVIVFFIAVLPLAGIYYYGFYLLQQGDPTLGGAVVAAWYITLIVLIGMAIYRAYKYRLSRTQWRGIRGGLSGSSFGYSMRFIFLTILQVITLGLATPFVTIRLYRYLLNNVWLGSGRLAFEADWKPLFAKYLLPGSIILVGAIVLGIGYYDLIQAQVALQQAQELGDDQAKAAALSRLASAGPYVGFGFLILLVGMIVGFWYAAAVYRTVLGGCTFEGVQFSGKLTGGRYLKFNLFNWFILILSGGFAYPWVQIRMLRLIAEVIEIHGEPDFAAISQSTEDMPKFGEGLAEAFL